MKVSETSKFFIVQYNITMGGTCMKYYFINENDWVKASNRVHAKKLVKDKYPNQSSYNKFLFIFDDYQFAKYQRSLSEGFNV